MAQGLLIFSQSKATSYVIRYGFSLSSMNLTKFHPRPTSRKSAQVRLLRSCCGSNRQDDEIDLSKYKETFSKRMAMAGLKPHHRIAVGVSGGPDSIALCLLAANWKSYGTNGNAEFVDGFLAITVDHGLRAESKNEAEVVQRRVLDMGVRCKVVHCNWTDGWPKQGHLQEAARAMRYEKLQQICGQHQIGVLLIAHHADDQAELFILRLSRNSGVLGLAGMALATQLFPTHPSLDDGALSSILLVRPLLDFSKEDLYKICKGGKQEWVEDPTNQSTLFARNRIRRSLGNLSSSTFKSELQAILSVCRRTRLYVDQICRTLIDQAVTVMPQGYAVVDLGTLNPAQVPDICLSKFVTLLLQFISQKQRPVRGNAQKLLLDYVRTFPCKSSFTAAGCYLCAAPGSKGTKLVICCSVNSALPMKMESFYVTSVKEKYFKISSGLEQIIADGRSYLDKLVPNASDVHFLGMMSCESILIEAKQLNILSESTLTSILSLQRAEMECFKLKTKTVPDCELQEVGDSVVTKELSSGQIGHFMDRFLISWELTSGDGGGFCCGSCLAGRNSVLEVRHMVDADWLYLAKLTKSENLELHEHERVLVTTLTKQGTEKMSMCSDFARVSAQRALVLLKSIPVAARRCLPVLVNPQGHVLSIPSIYFSICPCLDASAEFNPRVPLGGGHSSFL